MGDRLTAEEYRRFVQGDKAGPSSIQRRQALGRLPAGKMNKTEASYAEYLDQRKASGSVLWWKFEAMKFRLADKTFYSPDFSVLLADCTLEQHEVKGAPAIFQDDAKVKVKVAASLYPMRFWVAYPIRKGGWRIEEVSA